MLATATTRIKKDIAISCIVDDDKYNDLSSVALSPMAAAQLHIFQGSTVVIYGNCNKTAVAVVLIDERISTTASNLHPLRMSAATRENLAIDVGDWVVVKDAGDLPYATKVALIPTSKTVLHSDDVLFEDFVLPFFRDQYRPVKKQDVIPIETDSFCEHFLVWEVAPPSPACIVDNNTLFKIYHLIEEEKPATK